MVWEYWSTRYLQQALDEIDEDLLDDLEEILPPLRGDSFNPTELSNRSNLVDILSAFAPSDYFKKQRKYAPMSRFSTPQQAQGPCFQTK